MVIHHKNERNSTGLNMILPYLIRRFSDISFIVVGISFISLLGCAGVDRGIPVPPQLTTTAHVSGYNNIRYSGDESEHLLAQEFLNALKIGAREGHQVNMLALSGGGADGAFGAGLLCGWTVHGNRPMFQVVTGVSIGAFIAPFAFLGSEYDALLNDAYTKLNDDNVFVVRNIFSILRADSLTDTTPLFDTISNYIDDELLAAVAKEHKSGRRLFIMTTNLDSQYAVVWNMGAIAISGQPDALELFRNIIIASASIPIVFPPQYIKVEANGEKYTEMHVDGGVTGQVFLHLPAYEPDEILYPIAEPKVRVYIIRNSKVAGEYSAMPPLIIPILTRTIKTLVSTQGVGNLYEIYDETQERNAEYRLAYVTDDHKKNHHELFEVEAMKKMFDAAYSKAVAGYPWHDKPPKDL